MSTEELDAAGTAEVAWLDGILAVARGDGEGLDIALNAASVADAPGSEYLAQSLRAFGTAVDGDSAGAARQLADLEWASASSLQFVSSHALATPINRLAAAEGGAGRN